MKLPLKLTIFIIVIFGLLVTGMAMWKPMKVRYYANKYRKATTPQERIRIVDILCTSEAGKKALYDAFRERCISEQVKIPAGSFMMGSEKDRIDTRPVHKVTLSAFWMDKYEVTNEKYYVFIKVTDIKPPKSWADQNILEGKHQHPVIDVMWEEAKAFADWLEIRLPTEAEWEYACRAGSTTDYYYGNDVEKLENYAWMNDNSRHNTHPVGLKMPNRWGLYDMYGNVWELCNDLYGQNYYSSSPTRNPQGPENGDINGNIHVIRGGSFEGNCLTCSSNRRGFNHIDGRQTYEGDGFRCVRDVK